MSKGVSRRSFVKSAVGTGLALTLPRVLTGCGSEEKGQTVAGSSRPPPVLFVSIDSMPPAYLHLNSRGEEGGGEGDWFMPNVRRFVDDATLFSDARCYMPAGTDMNHLNALAGTSSSQTGILGVSAQGYNWNPDSTLRFEKPHISWVRDDQGRPVDTLFNAWKRKWPHSKTCYISGKFWVAEMFRSPVSDVDIIVTGKDHPGYVNSPVVRSFYDPPDDPDAPTDPESFRQVLGAGLLMSKTEHFPSDSWVVDASLKVLAQERPDLSVLLLAQMDDAQHMLGCISDPSEFSPCGNPLCNSRSKRNPSVYREPVLDMVRDIDNQFGILMQGINEIEYYRNATIVLYSDHGHVNHLQPTSSGEAPDMMRVLLEAGLITEEEKGGSGFSVFSASSVGEVYWMADTLEERRERARASMDALVKYEILNRETGLHECPWHILSREEMINGMPGVAEPGELWHPYFGLNNDRESLLWPDLILLLKNGWQLPVYEDVLPNLGIDLPFSLPPIPIFLGGHGAPDTQSIVMAMRGPGIARGKVVPDPDHEKNYRVSDLAVTVAEMFDLDLWTTTVGRDRSNDLL